MTTRKKALLLLEDIIQNKRYANLALKAQLHENFSIEERAFITALVYGTLDKMIQLDFIIDTYAKGRLQPKIRNILRIGVFQILYMDTVPDHSACDESVKLATDAGKGALTGYINCVLRTIVRNKENFPYPDRAVKPLEYLAVRYSYPLEMVRELVNEYGEEEIEKLFAFEPHYDTTFRINTEAITMKAFLHQLRKHNIEYTAGVYLPQVVHIKGNAMFDNKLFSEGKCSVQGEASMLAVLTLAPQKGERILDACAAPGGKTVYIAQLMGEGEVIALDKHPHRVELIAANSKRCGFDDIISPFCADTSAPLPELGLFDRVLVDAPCSGLGVLGAKPEIKNTFDLTSLKELEAEQGKILQNAADHVRPDGVLVYSTCTIRKWENSEIVKAFLAQNSSFSLESLEDVLPESLHKYDLKSGMLQLLPHRDGIDGFFIARMRRGNNHG